MASILRQIVASNRLKHEDTGLDLCYVTSQLLVTCVFYFYSLTIFTPLSFFLSSASLPLPSKLQVPVIFCMSPLYLPTSLLSCLWKFLMELPRRLVTWPLLRDRESLLDLVYMTRGIIITWVFVLFDTILFSYA